MAIDFTVLRTRYSENQIEKAVNKINQNCKANGVPVIPYEKINSSNGDVCMDCGSIFLLRTGTCCVCQICGTSQGCS